VTFDRPRWTVPSCHPHLPPAVVHVWTSSLRASPSGLSALASLLSPDEHVRADAFRVARHRDRFIVARGVLRLLLGRYLDVAPAGVRFKVGPFGRPELERPGEGCSFNVSHCEDLALIAVVCSGAVGVDVERVDPTIDAATLAADYFSRDEQAELSTAPRRELPLRFTRGWTRKEAYVKALGVGLSRPLREFGVVPVSGSTDRFQVFPDPGGERPVHVMDLIVRRQWAAALAFPAFCVEVQTWRWEGEEETARAAHRETRGCLALPSRHEDPRN
jgi:4'-phosphopantetheinyl transferase